MKMKQGHWETVVPIAALVLLSGCSALQPRAQLSIRSVEPAQKVDGASSQLEKGHALLRLGQNADAISAFRAALRNQAESAEANNGLAIAYDRIGRTDLAQRYFELAVAGAPDTEKFRANLARHFIRNGQPALANGLLDQKFAASDSRAVETVPSENLAAVLSEEPAVAIAALPVAPVILPVQADAVLVQQIAALDLRIAEVVETSLQPYPENEENQPLARASHVIPAVYRPKAPIMIRTAAIDPRGLPKQAPQRDPLVPFERMPIDVPRPAGMPLQRENVRLERVSLGEVRLVTRPGTNSTSANSSNFDSFGVRLASWLPSAIAIEKRATHIRISDKAGLKDAVARAVIEGAIAEVAQVEPKTEDVSEFSYAFFDGDTVEQVVLAQL
jgi:Tetratricopeptide repeat